MAAQYLTDRNGWLSFKQSTPMLYVTAEDDDFDKDTLTAWRDEGFVVEYVPMGKDGKQYVQLLHSLGDKMSFGERYAIVAFGDAAAVCLDVFSEPRAATSKLCSLIAYYPSSIPDTRHRFTASFRVLVHLAEGVSGDETVGVARRSEVLGIQGKRRTVQKRVTPGIGAGGLQDKITYPVFTYQGVEPGFAEHDLDEYNAMADAVAWSRSLSMVRRGFGAEVNLEHTWEENEEEKYRGKNIDKLIGTYVTNGPTPFVNFTPTMVGGHGTSEIRRFYKDYFLRASPPSMHMRLVSRTIGADHIVDELYIRFKHTCQMPWILPGIAPTNFKVEIVVVTIVGFRAGKVWCERAYWDQASVLFQVGLLDPDKVPEELKKQGLEMLPVSGSEAARKIMDVNCEEANDMIDDW